MSTLYIIRTICFNVFLPEFLEWFTLSNILHALDDLEQLVEGREESLMSDVSVNEDILGVSLATFQASRDLADDMKALALIPNYWRKAGGLEKLAAAYSIKSKIITHFEIRLFYSVWRWLEGTVTAAMESLDRAGRATSTNWASRLAQEIYSFFFASPLRRKEFWIGDYQPDGIATDNLPRCTLARELKCGYTHEAALIATRDGVTSVIQTGLLFPSDPAVRVKAQFITAVYSLSSPGVFYLPITRSSLASIPTRILGTRKRNRILSSAIIPFIHDLARHPISDPSSAEYQALSRIEYILTNMDQVYHRSISGGTPCNGPSSFAEYLRQFLPLLDDGYSPLPSTTACDMQNYVLTSQDRMLPFREHTPSRKVVRSVPSPFSPEHLRTSTGFFSAALIRAVTFGAPVLVEDNHTVFDLASWKALREQRTEDASNGYFTDIGSTDTASTSSLLDAVDKIHHSPGIENWESIVSSRTSFTSMEFFEHIYGGTSCKLGLFGFGSVGAYLLTADYTYAGLVDKPTLADMGFFVSKLKRGSYRGLQNIGLIPRDCDSASQVDVTSALDILHRYIEGSFSASELQTMGYDLFMLEHALCKFSMFTSSSSLRP